MKFSYVALFVALIALTLLCGTISCAPSSNINNKLQLSDPSPSSSSSMDYEPLTAEQLDLAKFLLNELSRLKEVNAKCSFNEQTKNETCIIHVDEEVDIKFVRKRIKFDAAISAAIDLKSLSVTLQVNIDNKWTYTHVYSLTDFAEVCYPFFEVLKLCVDLSNVQFSIKENCFVADLNVDVRVLTLKLKLLSAPISYHKEKCQAIKYNAYLN